VHKISIIPRGVAALGYTQQLPTDERYLMQRPELDDRMTVLLAGRAAEEIVFGEISTGAGNDLERATDIARRMVAELGMSEKIGPVTFVRRTATFLSPQDQLLNGRGDYSEATAQTIDAEVRRLLVGSYARARALLLDDRALLDELAHRLLEKEVVDRDELRALMDLPPAREGGEPRPQLGHAPAHAAD
jgi:cell division protease FtsH